jgi:hypothetical protein
MRLPTVPRPWAGRGRFAALLMTLATAAAFTLGLSLAATPASAAIDGGHPCNKMTKDWERMTYDRGPGVRLELWEKTDGAQVFRAANLRANGKYEVEFSAHVWDENNDRQYFFRTSEVGPAGGGWCSPRTYAHLPSSRLDYKVPGHFYALLVYPGRSPS